MSDSQYFENPKCCQFRKRRAPENYEDLSNQNLKILDMRPISTRKHEWILVKMIGGWGVSPSPTGLSDIFQSFFGHFWNIQNFDQIWTPDPLFNTKTLQQIQENSQLIQNNIIFAYQQVLDFQMFGNFRKDGHRTMTKIR